jgi:hypothetical protein
MKRIFNLSCITFLTMCFVLILGTSCNTEDNKLPTLTTVAITEVTQNTAATGGIITSDGGLVVTARGVCWSLKPNPTINDSITKNAAGSGEFTSKIGHLIADTIYYVRAYATNSHGTSYGLQLTFKTLHAVLPMLTTTEISDITVTSATSGGNITSDGGDVVTSRGVCWSLKPNPTGGFFATLNGAGTGKFTSQISDLIADTTYYVRAYATTKIGTAYGDQISFKTLPPIPYIVIGKITTDNKYYNPYFIVSTENDYHPYVTTDFECVFDVDNDGTNDFKFIAESHTDRSIRGSRCRIVPINKDYYLCAHLTKVVSKATVVKHDPILKQTTVNTFDSTYVFFSPDLFSINDTISAKCNFVNTEVNLWSYNYSYVSYPVHDLESGKYF